MCRECTHFRFVLEFASHVGEKLKCLCLCMEGSRFCPCGVEYKPCHVCPGCPALDTPKAGPDFSVILGVLYWGYIVVL